MTDTIRLAVTQQLATIAVLTRDVVALMLERVLEAEDDVLPLALRDEIEKALAKVDSVTHVAVNTRKRLLAYGEEKP